MEASELDNFIRKFKNLWSSGRSARLFLETCEGQSWVSLHAQLGSLTPPQQYHPPCRGGTARQRRRERRLAARESATRMAGTAEEAVATAEEILDDTTAEEAATAFTAEVEVVAEEAKEDLNDRVTNLETENDKLKRKVKELEQECDSLSNTIQVNDMLHESFKERV